MKYILMMALVILSTGLFAQSKVQIKKAEYYTNKAAEEFDLTETQTKTLYEARLNFTKSFASTSKQFRAGEITEDEKKAQSKKLVGESNAVLMKLTGKKMKDLNAFNKRMREELKGIK